ncbi:RHS repeat-associated protein [Luteimicrobium subarcticum]|uniref:RHS repeat-associated protein n=1 Tax=Luteimicrobium subarcticum TaxID=620910 RepID=A0A2M8W3L3_9MICO|nr:RHS repeat-associated protein [Luteimicrobium subarcticum]
MPAASSTATPVRVRTAAASTQPESLPPGAKKVKTVPGPTPTRPWSPPASAMGSGLGSGDSASEAVQPNVAAPAPDEAAGDNGSYTFQQFWAGGGNGELAIKVNVGSGNLFIKELLGAVAGPGVAPSASLVFNSQSVPSKGAAGGIWATDWDLTGLDITSTKVTFYDGTGEHWDFTGSGTSWTAPAGVNASLKKNSDGTWTVKYNRTGQKLQFNSSGWLTNHTDRNDVGSEYKYWKGGAADGLSGYILQSGPGVGQNFADGKDDLEFGYQTFADHPAALLASTTQVGASHNGLDTVEYARQPDNTLTSVNGHVLPSVNNYHRSGEQWTVTYDTQGHITQITTYPYAGTQPSSTPDRTIAFTYDSANRVTKVTQSRSGETSVVTAYAYSSAGTTVTDPRGNTITYDVDSKYRVTKVTDQLSQTRSLTYTANSDVATSTDGFSTGGGAGHVTTTSYDSNNNATKVALPTGAAAQAIYTSGTNCPAGTTGDAYQAKCTIDPSGNKRSATYDAAGNLTKSTDTTSGGTAESISYTRENGNGTVCGGAQGQVCTATDGNGKVTKYAYDHGNLATLTPPAPLGPTTYQYDERNRVTGVTDGNGHATTYTYDNFNNILTMKFANGQKITQVWNADGTLASKTDTRTGATITYSYNLLGKQTAQTVSTPSGSGISATVTMTYDANGNMLTSDATGSTLTYTYDKTNKVTQIREAGGTCPSSGNPAANSGCTLFKYDSNGQEIARIFPGGARQDTTRDASGRPTRITAKDGGGTVVADVGYAYSSSGADTDLIQTRTSYIEQGIPAGAVTTYSYDSKSRLTKAVEKSGSTTNASWAYAYDKSGNRTSQTRSGNTGSTSGSTTYTINAANQITSTSADTTTWTYDAAGELTRNGITGQTYTYGDRLEAATSGTTANTVFGPGNGTRLQAGTTGFLSTSAGLARSLNGTTAYNWPRDPNGTAISYNGTSPHYYVLDATGSVIGIFSGTGAWSGGYSYTPFGERRFTSTGSAVTSNTVRFANGYEDTVNIYKLGARYYDATLGSFTQFDPAGHEANPYAYASGNPVMLVDPSGQFSIANFVGGAVGGVVGGFVGTALCGTAAVFTAGLASVGCFIGAAVGGGLGGGIGGAITAGLSGGSLAGGAADGAVSGFALGAFGLLGGGLAGLAGAL